MRDEIDSELLREMEHLARQIGEIIGAAMEAHERKRGFLLMMFSFEGPELTYISNANRGDIIKLLEEFIMRTRTEGAQTSEQRN